MNARGFPGSTTPTWHCVCGRNFGSYVTHETKHFIYFYLGQVDHVLVQRVDDVLGAEGSAENLHPMERAS